MLWHLINCRDIVIIIVIIIITDLDNVIEMDNKDVVCYFVLFKKIMQY